jgi:hypothetical protein
MNRDELNQITRHHRKPKSKGGGNHSENISRIKMKHHIAWHVLVGDKDPEEIAELINEFYLDPEYKFVVKRTNYTHPKRKEKK